jgi:hypothetical protein
MTPTYTPLRAEMERQSIAVLDCAEAFLSWGGRYPSRSYMNRSGHYSPQGNELVADFLALRLRDLAGFKLTRSIRRLPLETF